jgi:hypothetical protein
MPGTSSPNWAEIATAGIAFVALFGAFIQLWSARRSNHRTNAFAYYGRYSDPDALCYLAEMTKLLRLSVPPETDDERWHEWNEKDLELRLGSLVFVNFWEELGGLYNRRLVDRNVIRIYLGAILVELWKDGAWFVTRCQEDDPRAFEEWGKMAKNTGRWLDRRDHPKRRWLQRGGVLSAIVALGAVGYLVVERGSTRPAQPQDSGHTGELLRLAEETEGGSAHGVIYQIAEIAEG